MFERKQPLISIVIPSWFVPGQHGRHCDDETYTIASHCLDKLLQVIFDKIDDYELIIIDNGSTLKLTNEDIYDHKKIFMSTNKYWSFANILIKNKNNLGFAPAMNQGFALARGKYIVALNNDIFIWENFFEDLIEVLEDESLSPRACLSMPNLIKKDFQKDCLTEDGKKIDAFKAMELKKENIVHKNRDNYEKGAEFGSAFAVKRELLEELKKKDGFIFDENFVGFFKEDRDLYKRLRLLGYETYRTNKIRCLHIGNLSVSKVANRKEYSAKNRELFEKKWKNN